MRKENGITMSKGLKPLPFTLLLLGSYLSDVTLRETRGTRSEVGPARRLAARERRMLLLLLLLQPGPAR